METLTLNSDWSDGIRFESLANLAHELRTPVQVLLGYLDILRDDRADAAETRGSDYRAIIERMNTNVHELAQTVENLLEFVLASAGAETAIEEEIEVAEFFAEIEEVLVASNRNPHLSISINLDAAPENIVAPRRPLRSIVLNLAINAIKFTLEGEVSICVSGDVAGSETIEIEVRDTGEGINQELLATAFEPLVQLSHSNTRRHRGLGLGLAMVQRHLKALGGRLEVASIPGSGSRFKVTIPCLRSVPRVCTSGHTRLSLGQ
jgi:signal transduction histidine kinase